MSQHLWAGYERAMKAYISALKSKLTEGWRGSYGFEGR